MERVCGLVRKVVRYSSKLHSISIRRFSEKSENKSTGSMKIKNYMTNNETTVNILDENEMSKSMLYKSNKQNS